MTTINYFRYCCDCVVYYAFLRCFADGGDDYDTVKISEFLKKHITKHMYMLDNLVLEPFNKEALPKVKTEIYKFQKHIEAIKLARNKTLDVGGEYTKPLRSKLNMLNDQLAAHLENFHQKCYQNKIHEAEIIEMQQETTDLYDANRNIVKGAFNYYSDEVERVVMLVSKDTEALILRREKRQAVKNECDELKKEISAMKESYRDIQAKLVEVGNNLTYTSAEASTQGAHIILALLSDMLQYFEAKNDGETTEAQNSKRLNMAELITKQRERAKVTQVDTEKILRHIMSYFGEEDFAILGAVFLDDSISRGMSQGLEEVVEEVTSLRVSMNSPGGQGQTTQIDAFNMTDEKESQFRTGTGIDPRKITNKKERKMSVVRMDSFVNDQTLPTALKTSDALPTSTPKSRESNSRGNSPRRPSVAAGGAGDQSMHNSRPTSQSRRPTSHNLTEGGKDGTGAVSRRTSNVNSGYPSGVPLSRESNDHFEELGGKLMEQFTQRVYSPSDQRTNVDFQSIVPAGAKLPAFNDSECTSLENPTMSTITTKTKGSSKSSKTKSTPANDSTGTIAGVPLLNQQNNTSRKATLALLPGGDGRVASYVAK